MIGSETFIIVAFRWTENRTPDAFAAAICSVRNASRAAARSTLPSTTSPASTFSPDFRTCSPAAVRSRIVRTSSAPITTDCSLWRKSSASIVATEVCESALQAPMRCGFLRA